MKAQRLKIVEPGMLTFTDFYCGYKFTNGLSDEAVAGADALRIGSFIRVIGVDDDRQAGEAQFLLDAKHTGADVKVALTVATPETVSAETAAIEQAEQIKYTKEALEAIADAEGIQGLRNIADKFKVKGRGIVELITEILKAQG